MAYDEELAHRIRELIGMDARLTETRMFGGLAFLVGGNMAVAASGNGGLMVRVAPDAGEKLVLTTPAETMVMKGRSVSGWLRVDAEALKPKKQLEKWVRIGMAYANSLPAKEKKGATASTRPRPV
ncbi:MAG: TfoX/Sxy family protein [Acidimicrobiales bacterium]